MKLTPQKRLAVRLRFRRALKQHTVLFLTQVGFACLVTFFWYAIVWGNGWRIDARDSEFYVGGVVFLASAAWVLKGTETLRVIWDQYREVGDAVKRADERRIVELKDEHVPLLVHFYLTMLAAITDVVIMALPYHSAASGAGAVFVVTLVFTFYAAIIFELEDPMLGGWVRERLRRNAPELLDVDSDAYFDRAWQRKRRKR